MSMAATWSCDMHHLYKLSSPLPKEAPHEILALIGLAVSEKMFENNCHIHVFSSRVGTDNPLGYFFINTIIRSI